RLRAISPDCVLYEPRKEPRIFRIDISGVDLLCNPRYEFGASVWLIARWPVGVIGTELLQDSGPVQKVMHQRIDCNHADTSFQPQRLAWRRSGQERRQCHVQHLVRDTEQVT